MFTMFMKAVHGYIICISTLKTALPRNDKVTRPVCIAKYSQKELLHTVVDYFTFKGICLQDQTFYDL